QNGIREKVILRASSAHQTGSDVVKSAILGADSFEFGTTALMMLKCVMAKNCNVKCPAGLTTNPEVFEGDARALAQFFLNIAHDVRRILARLGCASLKEVRGKTSLLHLIEHPSIVGKLDFRDFLSESPEVTIEKPIYLEADFSVDDSMLPIVRDQLIFGSESRVVFEGDRYKLKNSDKTVGGQLAIDIERILAYDLSKEQAEASPVIEVDANGRRTLMPESVVIRTTNSAGQSYACWMNEGMLMEHTGVCNDGVAKGACGGVAVIKSPGGGSFNPGENVLIGNFALFGATGGQVFVNGEAGDRFAVRNSGALSVVEGVGDFCCEYMTSGAVLNLGTFGMGFCNGMSGGNAYQYDPDDMLKLLHSADSVIVKSLADETEEVAAHEAVIKAMLTEHVRRTGSVLGQKILDQWSYEKQFFKYAVPRALYRTQTAEGILGSMDQKAMVEELSFAIAGEELKTLAQAYKAGQPVLQGLTPDYGAVDTTAMFRLLNAYSHVAKAINMAREQLSRQGLPDEGPRVDELARNLIEKADRKLLETIAKDTREALSIFNKEELASKLARKRINDYKAAMRARDVQVKHSPGTTAWIAQQERANEEVSVHLMRFEESLAERTLKTMI
ncbi:MAG: glutamate synthase-related protein, partial [Puniceicoccales bacterium]